MIGLPAIFTMAGMAVGTLAGWVWGVPHGIFAGLALALGGLATGGVLGCLLGVVPRRIEYFTGKFSRKHGFYAKVLSGLAYLLWLGLLIAIAMLAAIVLRAMRGHY